MCRWPVAATLSLPIVMLERPPEPVSPPRVETSHEKPTVAHEPVSATTTNSSGWISNPQMALVLLNVVAILWGTQHAVIKSVVTEDGITPATFTLCRFALAALVALPAGLSEWFRTTDDSLSTESVVDGRTLARWGAEMGFWMFLGFALQAIGLETTTAQKSGFLLYLNVKLVPFFAWIGYGRTIRTSTWISAAAAILGTALMGGLWWTGNDTTLLTDAQRWNIGDVWSIGAAAASAMFILRLESASQALPRHSAALNAASLAMVTLLSVTWASITSNPNDQSSALDSIMALTHLVTHHGWEFLYLGGVTTAVANWIQTSAQRHVSAERASLIYAMDPVYGAAFSYLWLGEALPGMAGWIGAGLIATAAASNAWMEWDQTQLTSSSAEETAQHKKAASSP